MNILKSKRDRLWSFQNVIVVSGGKGGVGKSTLALNLACALGKNGLSVGLLDLDVSGPDLPWMTGARYKGATAGVALNWPIYEKEFSVESMIQPLRRWGVSLASIGFFVGENDAVTLAGEVMQTVVRQLEYQVNWGDLDVLIVDSPPGTGPVPQAAISELKPTGALIVVTPQDIAALDAGRAMALHENKNIPVLGVIRNMTTMLCDHCGSELHLFHDGKNAEYANDSIRILGDLPFDPSVSEAGDIGVPMVFHKPDSPWAERVTEIAGLIVPEAATD